MKPPKILHIDAALVDNAVTLWREGGLVAFPTETVYGLGADATNSTAVAKIYEVKSRPQFNPLIVHVANKHIAGRYVQWTPLAEKLAERFWPGPLTLVLKKRIFGRISDLVSNGGDTLAIRAPSHPVAQQLLMSFGGGIAAPSANRSGKISPTAVEHVHAELGKKIPLIIDGGHCEVGLESTVLDISGDTPVLLRPGSITREMLEAVIFDPKDKKKAKAAVGHAARQELRTPDAEEDVLKSPGRMESHYAPATPMRLSAVDVAADEALLAFGPNPPTGALTTLNLSPTGNLVEAATNLFAYMRELDNEFHSAIAVMHIPKEGLGEAIADRLRRAAASPRSKLLEQMEKDKEVKVTGAQPQVQAPAKAAAPQVKEAVPTPVQPAAPAVAPRAALLAKLDKDKAALAQEAKAAIAKAMEAAKKK